MRSARIPAQLPGRLRPADRSGSASSAREARRSLVRRDATLVFGFERHCVFTNRKTN